ncbi:myb-related transcription factor, partner of profilin-like [Ambystoma mexicanum]|uniref:myb-related transcription factor, partner of profilin-like n=1 Tax=Ambystoma mexicanum TaxID=8296 RepID=UPI0037E9C892
MLAETLAAHADVIKSQNLKQEMHQRKKEIWQEVARKVSAVGTCSQSVWDCKKRWDDLRLRVCNILASNRREAMSTGGGPHSPAKLTTWEETASTFISPESIEGFGDTETGAATSPEGEKGCPQKRATHTTTSGAALQPTPTASVPDTLETQLTTSTPVEGESLEALATTEDDIEELVDQEGVTKVTCTPAPSPLSTPLPQMQPSPTYSSADPCLHDSDLSPFTEDSTEEAGPVTAPPTTPAPTNTLESRLVTVEARQESMLELLRQYIVDGDDTRREIATAIAGTTAAITANTATVNASAVLMRDCLGAITQLLTSPPTPHQPPHLLPLPPPAMCVIPEGVRGTPKCCPPESKKTRK